MYTPRRTREQKAASTRTRMLIEVRDDLQQLTVATLSRKMDYLNNGQMALIKREMFRLRALVEDCCAYAVVPNTEPSATPTPSPHKRGPLLKQVRNRAKKAAGTTQSCASS